MQCATWPRLASCIATEPSCSPAARRCASKNCGSDDARAVSPLPHSERTASHPPSLGQAPTEAYYASRALQALELLTFNDLSCPQVAATLQIHPRTARRLLLRLAADGYIKQTFDRRRRY